MTGYRALAIALTRNDALTLISQGICLKKQDPINAYADVAGDRGAIEFF
jgi:hypothetical protein